MVNKGTDRYLGVTSVHKKGSTFRLADGEVGLFFRNRTDSGGLKVVPLDGLLSIPNDEDLVIRAGIPGANTYLGGEKTPASTIPFTKNKILEVGVSAPTTTKRTDDVIIIGFDGINSKTIPVMYPGETRKVTIEVSGEPISALGVASGRLLETFTVYAPGCSHDECVACDRCAPVDMVPIFQKLQKDILTRRISAKHTLGDIIDVELITENCGTLEKPITEDVDEYQISVPDSGSHEDLQAVQTTTNGKVVLKSRQQGISTYVATDYPYRKLETEDLVIKKGDVLANCETCPDGFTQTTKAGYLYTVVYNPTKVKEADIKALITANIVGSRDLTVSNEVSNLQVVAETIIPKDEIDVLLGVAGVVDVADQGKVGQVCKASSEVRYSWEKSGNVSKVTKFKYLINLEDTCGTAGSRLDELKAAYPELNVKFEDKVTSATCLSQYSAEVYSNVVAENCAGATGTFTAQKPNSYQGSDWYCEDSTSGASGCSVGLRIRGGWLDFEAPEGLLFEMPFYGDPVLVDAAAGINTYPYADNAAKDLKQWSVTRVSAATKPSHLGITYMKKVAYDSVYFKGETPNLDAQSRFLSGEYSLIKPSTFYVDYYVTIGEPVPQNMLGYVDVRTITYHFISEFGKHQEIEELINRVAQLGGKPSVSASSNIE